MNILVTGAAGFIGFHLVKNLLEQGHKVTGLDNLNTYYDVQLKLDRLKELGVASEDAQEYYNRCTSSAYKDFRFYKLNLEDRANLPSLFQDEEFDVVVNLAAQAGVRYSIENPEVYIDSNISGFLNLLECCKDNNIKKIVYASSSSVYGQNKKVPFSTEDNVDNPISIYAATKRSNELMAYTYSHLFNMETIGLRFFTVYGPWGRPDMAMFLFTDAIINNRPIKVFNEGDLMRDFTYIDDIVNGVVKVVEQPVVKSNAIYNIGNSKPVKLMDFINEIEIQLNRKAEKQMLPMQPGDVNRTWADVEDLKKDYNYCPDTSINEGVKNFIDWYMDYYKVNK